MKRPEALAALVPPDAPRPVVDVGADHAEVAARLGAWAVERLPHRRSGSPVPWVISDGLAAFRAVGTAIIAGMGADRILGILDRGPQPEVAVVHAVDDPGRLRRGLVARGWRIDAEALSPDGRAFAELIRVRRGHDPHTDDLIELGPLLLRGEHPLFRAWRAHRIAWHNTVLADLPPTATSRTAALRAAREILARAPLLTTSPRGD